MHLLDYSFQYPPRIFSTIVPYSEKFSTSEDVSGAGKSLGNAGRCWGNWILVFGVGSSVNFLVLYHSVFGYVHEYHIQTISRRAHVWLENIVNRNGKG